MNEVGLYLPHYNEINGKSKDLRLCWLASLFYLKTKALKTIEIKHTKCPYIPGIRVNDMANFLINNDCEAYLPPAEIFPFEKRISQCSKQWLANMCFNLRPNEFNQHKNKAIKEWKESK